MYQNYTANYSNQISATGQWGVYSEPGNTDYPTDEYEFRNSADFDFGDTTSPLVRQGILPPVHIVLGADDHTFGVPEFPDFTTLFGDDNDTFNVGEADNWLAGVANVDDNEDEEFITYIRRMPDGTKIFVHTPANEEGIVQRVVEPDGTMIEHYLNGDRITEFPHHASGGLAYSLESRDGSRIYEYVDGSRVMIKGDGTTSFEYADTDQAGSAA